MMCVSTEPVQNVLQDPTVCSGANMYVVYVHVLCSMTISMNLLFSLIQLLVKQYEQEIRALKQELTMHDTLVS